MDLNYLDRGPSYRASIFYHNEEQRQKAETSKELLAASNRYKKPVVTPIVKATPFYPAEEYHQDFYKKNPDDYLNDRKQSGRDEFIQKHW